MALYHEQPTPSQLQGANEPHEELCDDKLLVDALKENRVDARGALGGRFDRWLSQHPDMKQARTRGCWVGSNFGLLAGWLSTRAFLGLGVMHKTCLSAPAGVPDDQRPRQLGKIPVGLGQGPVCGASV